MNKRRIPTFLIILMLMPLVNTVQADSHDEPHLEAKNLAALVDATNETVTLTWGNIDTNDFTILENLKTTNYSLYRSDEPLNSSNYQQAEMVEDSIQACLTSDTLLICKNRAHVVVYNTPPNTDGSYYYGVISTLENGSIIDNLSIGNATLNEPVNEFGSPIVSPYNLQAAYDIENSTTHLSWIDVSQVDTSSDSNHTTSIWSHSTQANISNWEILNKTQIVANLSSDVNSYEIIHPSSVSRVNFYTVLHSFDGQVDSRLLSGNTLDDGITEDNVGSVIAGVLLAQFNATEDQTALNWNGSIIEDQNHTLHIWRSASPITDVSADGVVEIVQLPANSTHYNFTIAPGYSGESYYLITLSDELGNHQTDLGAAPNAHLYEFTLTTNQNIVTDLSAAHSMGVTLLTWTDLANHSEASYQIWRSTTGQINATTFDTSSVNLLATVEAGVQHYNNTFADGISEYSWYAVTVVASFGTLNTTYQQTNLSLTLNSLSAYVAEDTKNPTAPAVLNANYLVNGTTQLSWIGSTQEQGTMWNIYRNLYTDLDEESFWVPVAQMENDGTSLHMVFVDTVAQNGEVVTPVYAIEGTDVFGNSMAFDDWRLSSEVVEDRQAPYVQLQLYDSQMQLETSRWFNGGETATFSNLEVDNYTIKFEASDDSASIAYTMSTDSGPKNLNLLGQQVANIEIEISDQIANITISFTITDVTGNTASFSTIFCTSCLIQTPTIDQPDIQEPDDNEATQDKTEDEILINVNLLIGLCVALLLVILYLISRSPKPKKTLSGLPSRSEDAWVSSYITGKKG